MAVHNLEYKDNENVKISYLMREPGGVGLLDLTGTVVMMQIRLLPADTDTVFEASSEDVASTITIDTVTSTISVNVPWSTVQTWTFTTAYYDVIVEWSADDRQNLSNGKIKLSKGVTR